MGRHPFLHLRTWLILTLAGGLVACGQEDSDQRNNTSTATEVEVSAITVTREEIVTPIIATGTMAALRTADLGPLVDGVVQKIDVVVGDRVKKGDPLFHTRKVDYELMLADARHRLDQAKAELAKAERDRDRAQTLKAKGAATNKLAEDAETRYQLAKAQKGQAETALKRAQQNIKDTTVYAPFDGVVVTRYVDEGVYKSVRGGMGGMPGMEGGGGSGGVIRLMQIDIVAAIVNMSEVHLSKVKLGTPATLTIEGVNGSFPSQIHVINDWVKAESRTVELRLGIANPDYTVKPGLFVSAEIMPEARPALILPRQVLQGGGDNSYVYQAENGLAKITPVDIRDIDANRVEVLAGLEMNDQVLGGMGLSRLYEGAPISLVEQAADKTTEQDISNVVE